MEDRGIPFRRFSDHEDLFGIGGRRIDTPRISQCLIQRHPPVAHQQRCGTYHFAGHEDLVVLALLHANDVS